MTGRRERRAPAAPRRPGWVCAAVLVVIQTSTALPLSAQVFGEAARTEFFGGFGVRAFYARTDNSRLLSDGDRISNASGREVIVDAIPVAVVYGLRPGLSLIGIVPSVSRTFRYNVNERQVSETDRGIGDIRALAKYRLYKRYGYNTSRQIALQVGVKLPTGSDDLEDRQGLRFPQPLQLGSGSVDYEVALVATEFRNRLVLSGDIGYALKTEANGFEFGDVFRYDAAAKFRLYPTRYTNKYPVNDLFVFVEVNGTVAARAKSGGRTIEDSGGHEVFLAPGFQFFPLENFILEAGVQLPMVDGLNGTQLGSRFRLRSGLRWIVAL